MIREGETVLEPHQYAVYTMPYQITSYDADRYRELRPSAILRLQQETAEQHLASVGYPYTRLFDEQGIFFAVVRMNTQIYESPPMGRHVRIHTWSAGVKGSQFLRCFQFADEDGKLLLESLAVYALLDAASHKLLRPDKTDLPVRLPVPEKQIGAGFPEKIRLPADAALCGHFPVRYSAVDYNGHMNNTVYPDLLTDFVPGGMENRVLRAFTLQYHSEALEGDTLELRCGETEGAYLFSCAHARGVCFSARVSLAARG